MKHRLVLLLVIAFVFSGNGICHASALPTVSPTDSTAWLQQLKAFQKAIAANDTAQVKTFIDFPMTAENNEIWYLVETEDEQTDDADSSNGAPRMFTEKDFDTYYGRLFTKAFRTALPKLNVEELYKKGETETVKFTEGKTTTYFIYATFEKESNSFNLNLGYAIVERDKKGKITDSEEFGTIYFFEITNDSKIKFRKVGLAG